MLAQTELNHLSLKHNIPISATVELTRRCAYSCLHCYLPETKGRARPRPEDELSADEWGAIFGELKKLGAMSIAITGGEPLLRKDLPEICTLAVKHNMDLSLYTSLYQADTDMLERLKKAGLKKLEVSLYGREKIYEQITRAPGSFQKTLARLQIARRKGFRIKIKTPIMRLNARELSWLHSFCMENAFILGVDPQLTPANDGEKSSAELLPEEEDIRQLFKKRWFKPQKNAEALPAKDFPVCGAGRNVISIDPYGNIYPCLQLPVKVGNTRNKNLALIWKKSPELLSLRKSLSTPPKKCRDCRLLDYCARCPGLSLLYGGSVLKIYPDACSMAKLLSVVYIPHRSSYNNQ